MGNRRSSMGGQIEIRKFLTVLGVVVLSILAVYFFTRIFVTKDLFNKAKTTTADSTLTINYNLTTVGLMLSRPYDEYYVFAYYVEGEDELLTTLDETITKYVESENAKKIYYLNLAEATNKDYYSTGKTNPGSSNLADLKLGKATLIKVKRQKISQYFETEKTIKAELKAN